MIGSRIAVLSGKSLDPDAKAFAAASGATDVAALSAFAKGIKDLGLWSSMVCWPLRRSQNAGAAGETSNVFSFGGGGTFNGTIVNGAPWGADGADFNGSNQRVSTTLNLNPASYTLFAVSNPDSVTGRRTLIAQTIGGAVAGFHHANDGANAYSEIYDGGFKTASVAGAAIGAWQFSAMVNNAGSFVSRINASVSGAGSASAITQSQFLVLGALGGAFNFDGKIAFAGYITAAVDATTYAALRDLYKSTLGAGLGLP
jgi:hypothetical protein